MTMTLCPSIVLTSVSASHPNMFLSTYSRSPATPLLRPHATFFMKFPMHVLVHQVPLYQNSMWPKAPMVPRYSYTCVVGHLYLSFTVTIIISKHPPLTEKDLRLLHRNEYSPFVAAYSRLPTINPRGNSRRDACVRPFEYRTQYTPESYSCH